MTQLIGHIIISVIATFFQMGDYQPMGIIRHDNLVSLHQYTIKTEKLYMNIQSFDDHNYAFIEICFDRNCTLITIHEDNDISVG